jgi:hypothetical protein
MDIRIEGDTVTVLVQSHQDAETVRQLESKLRTHRAVVVKSSTLGMVLRLEPKPTDLVSLMYETIDRMQQAKNARLEMLAAAFLAFTNLDPRTAELVQEVDSNRTFWYFRKRRS